MPSVFPADTEEIRHKCRFLTEVLSAMGATMVRIPFIVRTILGLDVISIFSIFAVSMIQQSTSDHLLGKVMAYTSAITMCAQPVGQMAFRVFI